MRDEYDKISIVFHVVSANHGKIAGYTPDGFHQIDHHPSLMKLHLIVLAYLAKIIQRRHDFQAVTQVGLDDGR